MSSRAGLTFCDSRGMESPNRRGLFQEQIWPGGLSRSVETSRGSRWRRGIRRDTCNFVVERWRVCRVRGRSGGRAGAQARQLHVRTGRGCAHVRLNRAAESRGAGRLEAGQSVPINGAGGCVGSIAVQIAKADGARVRVSIAREKLEMIRSLGADHVIDFTQADFTRRDERYDLILDVASTLSLHDCKRVLTPEGIYVFIGHDHIGRARGRFLGSVPRLLASSRAHDSIVTCRASRTGLPASKTPWPS